MAAHVDLEVGDRTIRISNPDRVYFPARGETKLDLARYYVSVGDGIVRALPGPSLRRLKAVAARFLGQAS